MEEKEAEPAQDKTCWEAAPAQAVATEDGPSQEAQETAPAQDATPEDELRREAEEEAMSKERGGRRRRRYC